MGARLSELPIEDQERLIRLPYQVGVWMSYQDDDTGDEDDARETRQLDRVLAMMAKRHRAQPLLDDIFTALAQARQSGGLDVAIDATVAEARAAVKTLRTLVGGDVASMYGQALVEIAATVAAAHGEEAGYEAVDEEPDGFFDRVLKKAGAAFEKLRAGADPEMKVSPAEQTALQELYGAIGR